jgi:hypothetical protein
MASSNGLMVFASTPFVELSFSTNSCSLNGKLFVLLRHKRDGDVVYSTECNTSNMRIYYKRKEIKAAGMDALIQDYDGVNIFS